MRLRSQPGLLGMSHRQAVERRSCCGSTDVAWCRGRGLAGGRKNETMTSAAKTRLDLTLGVPMKNSAAYLPELFDSLEAQSCLPSQILFVDDESNDSSVKTVETFAARHPGWPIHIDRCRPGIGIGAVYNRIAAASRRTWTQILDADDYLMPGFYRRITPYLTADNRGIVTAIRSNIAALNLLNAAAGPFIPKLLPHWLPVLGSLATRSGVLYRTADLLREPFIDPAFDGSDILHLIKLRAGTRFVYLDTARVFYRVHAGSATNRPESTDRFRRQLRRHPTAGWPYHFDYLLRKRLFARLRTRLRNR